MHDATRVRGVEAVGDLHCQLEEIVEGDRAPADDAVQRLAVEQLGDDVRLRVVRADVVDRGDVRMFERRGRARLLREPAQALDAVRDPRRQNFDRDVALAPRIARAIHLAHAAAANESDDLVRTEPRTGGQKRQCWGAEIIPNAVDALVKMTRSRERWVTTQARSFCG